MAAAVSVSAYATMGPWTLSEWSSRASRGFTWSPTCAATPTGGRCSSFTAEGRPDTHGARRQRRWPPRDGGQSPSTYAATATATGHRTVTTRSLRSVRDCVAVCDKLGKPPVLVGASLGGMSAMLAEGTSDRPVSSGLVLVDITPRTNADGIKRITEFMRSGFDGFDSLEAAAEAIAAYTPHRTNESTPRD